MTGLDLQHQTCNIDFWLGLVIRESGPEGPPLPNVRITQNQATDKDYYDTVGKGPLSLGE